MTSIKYPRNLSNLAVSNHARLEVPQAKLPDTKPTSINGNSNAKPNYISFSQDDASRPNSTSDSLLNNTNMNLRRLSNAGDFKMEIFNTTANIELNRVSVRNSSLKNSKKRRETKANIEENGRTMPTSRLADQIQHLLDKENHEDKEDDENDDEKSTDERNCCEKFIGMFTSTIDPQSNVYLIWLFVTSCAWLYNLWIVPVRWAFQLDNSKPWIYDNVYFWFCLDYMCDTIYLMDILLFKTRLEFIDKGKKVCVYEQTRAFYFASFQFRVDGMSLLPLDVLYFLFGYKGWPCLLRFVRILRYKDYSEFVVKCEQHLKSPHLFRITKTLMYLIFVIHMTACLYFAMSTDFGIGKNPWVYQGDIQIPFVSAYLRCFYWGLKTVTAIGNSDFPITSRELLFSMTNYLVGVFFFAIVIGQLREVLDAATSTQNAFRGQCDATLNYLRARKVPDYMLLKVRMWFDYVWETQNMVDNREALDSLPDNLKAELRLDVNLKILKKVTIFQGLSEMFLNDLVLRLRPIIYIPGDYVCKKGEVGKEMYIVSRGVVQVAGEDEASGKRVILATLQPGAVFGEVSLLGIKGMSRRTADIISPGFANLFVLEKSDLYELTKEYPAAQKAIKERTRQVAKQYGKSASRFREASKLLVGKKPEMMTKLLKKNLVKKDPNDPDDPGTGDAAGVTGGLNPGFLANLKSQIEKEKMRIDEENKASSSSALNQNACSSSAYCGVDTKEKENYVSTRLEQPSKISSVDHSDYLESPSSGRDMSQEGRRSRYRQKPVPPPRQKGSILKSFGAPQSLDENLVRFQNEEQMSKESLNYKQSGSLDFGTDTLKLEKRRGLCEDLEEFRMPPPIPQKPDLGHFRSSRFQTSTDSLASSLTPVTLRKRTREASIKRETRIASSSQLSRMSSRECAELLVNTLDHFTLTRMIEGVVTAAAAQLDPELFGSSRQTSVNHEGGGEGTGEQGHSQAERQHKFLQQPSQQQQYDSSTTLYGASSIQHQKENVNQSEPEHYTSLADTKRMERQRPITSENNSTNKNKDFGETTSPPNYKASSGFPNMDGVNIPIDLDALLDSLVIPWDPPDNDIDDIMKAADEMQSKKSSRDNLFSPTMLSNQLSHHHNNNKPSSENVSTHIFNSPKPPRSEHSFKPTTTTPEQHTPIDEFKPRDRSHVTYLDQNQTRFYNGANEGMTNFANPGSRDSSRSPVPERRARSPLPRHNLPYGNGNFRRF